MGLLPDPPPNMDLSPQCNRWPDLVQDTRRGDLLFRDPDLQYLHPLPFRQ